METARLPSAENFRSGAIFEYRYSSEREVVSLASFTDREGVAYSSKSLRETVCDHQVPVAAI